MPGVAGIVNYPTAITTQNLAVKVASATSGLQRSIILCAAAEPAPALGDVHVVVHGSYQTFAAVFPGQPPVVAHVEPAIVYIIDTTCRACGHNKVMMIAMSVVGFPAFGIPTRYFPPSSASVGGEMQIHAATKDVLGIARMNHDSVAVINLVFLGEMPNQFSVSGLCLAANLSPRLPTIFAPVDALQ